MSRIRTGFYYRFSPAHLDKQRCRVWLCGWLAIALLLFGSPSAASASTHRYSEAGDRVLWRSLQTLRDEHQTAWQIVFYKRMKAGETDSLNLRLVGFPGGAELTRQPLTISTRDGQTWTAFPVTDTPLPNTAGEYDLRPVMFELNGNPAIELYLPTAEPLKLTVPPFVIQEWKTVAQKAS
ncbi:DUF3122 domain-containing protein [Microcoleus sp. FACHB-1515]|uniref:DUF3122 domain-containing protein n=1 Tax=Cyanophyceae TaxID=3028117 RepID=UPI0016854B4D|nr:DUF3122 domain-containing protein [Microcoleus sp. FACHB-1515]MBD2093110.1 DUF3122 domain-containing protein [Microcoleus sp. FACHB-1515]